MEEEKQVEKKEKEDDEISLIDLFAVVWRYKIMIIAITLSSMIFIVVYCVISLKLPPEESYMPNEYTSKAEMLITDSSSGSMASMLNSSGLGSLAGLVGVTLPSGTTNSGLAKYLIYSNSVLDELTAMFNFTEKYGIEKNPIASTRKAIKNSLKVEIGEESGVFAISFTDIDPIFARDVVNYAVKLLEKRFSELTMNQNIVTKENLEENIAITLETIDNIQKQISDIENSVSNVYNPYGAPSIVKDTSMLRLELDAQKEIYKQLKAQLEVTKVELASEKPVFQILEYAEVPDIKSGPSRGKLCIIVALAAFFVSIFFAFLINAINNVRRDPVVIEKLKRKK